MNVSSDFKVVQQDTNKVPRKRTLSDLNPSCEICKGGSVSQGGRVVLHNI